ncbi:S8 family peptidase, partial [Mycobacterium sp. KBS0706]|uniref:S8 family peptidase n=1 Tax=Mycobacterium sp. KBS0706 TaxID=2578109 RepID=UPI001C8F8467
RPQDSVQRWPPLLGEEEVRNLLLRTFGQTRWTQDSPIVADVWIGYLRIAEKAARRRILGPRDLALDVLLTPWTGVTPGQVALSLRERLVSETLARARIATSSTRVVAEIDFQAFVQAVVPLTGWWQDLWSRLTSFGGAGVARVRAPDKSDAATLLADYRGPALELLRYMTIVGFVARLQAARSAAEIKGLHEVAGRLQRSFDMTSPAAGRQATGADLNFLFDGFRDVAGASLQAAEAAEAAPKPGEAKIWLATCNREASQTIFDSCKTVKADAAQRVFDTAGKGITIAVIDDGIDARHAAFLRRADPAVSQRLKCGPPFTEADLESSSRIQATYDFSVLRDILAAGANGDAATVRQLHPRSTKIDKLVSAAVDYLKIRADTGRGIDWALVSPLILVPHDDNYQPPAADHGTHVAGILAADLPKPDDLAQPLYGMCKELSLYDLRVFAPDGSADEFAIVSAIEFVGWLNRDRASPVIHGVNLSLALRHDVDSFACGHTPVCDACNQLVGAGTVVVAAAGNTGFDGEPGEAKQSLGTGYRTVSITDPGNAEAVITVGSTHRRDPHAYGVSYFSSRGPTGDGRLKPDLLAPGEKITSTIRENRTQRLDGTSMAAPHVCGAAALLMARYPELIGQPRRIKEILMKTATDLGRHVDFQGAGLLDVLRALQLV